MQQRHRLRDQRLPMPETNRRKPLCPRLRLRRTLRWLPHVQEWIPMHPNQQPGTKCLLLQRLQFQPHMPQRRRQNLHLHHPRHQQILPATMHKQHRLPRTPNLRNCRNQQVLCLQIILHSPQRDTPPSAKSSAHSHDLPRKQQTPTHPFTLPYASFAKAHTQFLSQTETWEEPPRAFAGCTQEDLHQWQQTHRTSQQPQFLRYSRLFQGKSEH